MRFKVSGALKTTGEDVAVVVEAVDFRAAEAKANAMGIVVSLVLPDEPGSQAVATDQSPVESGAAVQTIEATAKRWKLFIMVGAVLVVVGMIVGGASIANGYGGGLLNSLWQWAGIILFLVGFVLFIIGRIGKFWFHD